MTLQLFTSSLYLAAAFSALAGSYATRRWGRRSSMITAGLLFLIGIALQVRLACIVSQFTPGGGGGEGVNWWVGKETNPHDLEGPI